MHRSIFFSASFPHGKVQTERMYCSLPARVEKDLSSCSQNRRQQRGLSNHISQRKFQWNPEIKYCLHRRMISCQQQWAECTFFHLHLKLSFFSRLKVSVKHDVLFSGALFACVSKAESTNLQRISALFARKHNAQLLPCMPWQTCFNSLRSCSKVLNYIGKTHITHKDASLNDGTAAGSAIC